MRVLGEYQTTLRKALTEIDPYWESYPGLIICGTHNPVKDEVESMILKISEARIKGTPFLGICFGHQLAAIEYARNVQGIEDATSEEFGKGTYVVRKRKNLNVGLHNGESFWNNYEVVIEMTSPENFFTTQYHPEYQSSIDKPHQFLVQFINFAKKYGK